MTLQQFLTEIDEQIDRALSNETFHQTQRDLLTKTVERYRPLSAANPFADPLWRSLLYFVVRANGREIDNQVRYIGSFCTLYLLAADLMDDMQDDDLVGKPHESVGSAVAANDAVALLFLALKFMEDAAALASPERARKFYELFNHTSILAVAGQHRDLLGIDGARLPDEVLEMLRSRNSSLSMVLQLGALLTDCDDETCSRYARLAETIVIYGQIREDLSDIFGKELSPDLGTHKVTYPIACFLEDANGKERDTCRNLLTGLPNTLHDIRTLLYQCGTVQRCAEKMEQLREDIHEQIAELGNHSGYMRCILQLVDGFAESVYEPPPIECTRAFFEPTGAWHDHVRSHLTSFLDRMSSHSPPPAPSLVPWHLPHWLYEPTKRTIYYPDLEDLAEEILPLQSKMLRVDDNDTLLGFQWKQVPGTLSHEMFHYWRDVSGRLTSDHWHEEWVANKLAVAYVRHFEPDALCHTLEMARHVVGCSPELLDEQALVVLSDCERALPEARQNYEMNMAQITAMTFEMLLRIMSASTELSETVRNLLGKAGTASEIAA